MTELTVRFQTDKPEIDPDFVDNLSILASQYGIQVKNESELMDSIQMIREDRDMLELRAEEHVFQSLGPRNDLSHLDRLKG